MKVLVLLAVVCAVALAADQMILHPNVYYMTQMDTSLDNSPKCMTCRHITTALRNHFATSTSLSSDGIFYEADPCSLAPEPLKNWCGDVYKKLLQCDLFTKSIWDRSESVVKLCEECTYDQFPLPSVRYCDNSLYQPVDDDQKDQCNKCIDMITRISTGAEACDKLSGVSCTEFQNHLASCQSYNKYIHQPFVFARRICEECPIPLEDNTRPLGISLPMYCVRPTPSPMLDNSMCSVCVNVVHNTRTFPMDSPCRDMNDETCSYVQDRLQSCMAFNRMKDQYFYSALAICEECTDNKNPMAPQKFCTATMRAASSHLVFDPRKPEAVNDHSPGVFTRKNSPFLKPEPPAPFPAPLYLKMGYPSGGNQDQKGSKGEGGK